MTNKKYLKLNDQYQTIIKWEKVDSVRLGEEKEYTIFPYEFVITMSMGNHTMPLYYRADPDDPKKHRQVYDVYYRDYKILVEHLLTIDE